MHSHRNRSQPSDIFQQKKNLRSLACVFVCCACVWEGGGLYLVWERERERKRGLFLCMKALALELRRLRQVQRPEHCLSCVLDSMRSQHKRNSNSRQDLEDERAGRLAAYWNLHTSELFEEEKLIGPERIPKNKILNYMRGSPVLAPPHWVKRKDTFG